MRILLVIHALPPRSLGGSELYTVALAKVLSRRHTVFVLAGDTDASGDDGLRFTNDAPFTTCRMSLDAGRSPALTTAYDNADVDRLFRRSLTEIRPDIIHIHGIWGLSNGIPIIGRRFGCPVVFTLHDFWLMCPRGQRLRPTDLSRCESIDAARCSACLAPWVAPRRLPTWRQLRSPSTWRNGVATTVRRGCARLLRPHTTSDARTVFLAYHARTREVIDAVDTFVSPSRFLRTQFVDYGIPADKILHLENGLDVDRFNGCRTKSESPVVRFGFIGSLMPSKGVHLLLEAFRGLDGRATLTICGGSPAGDGGAYERELRTGNDDGRIRFTGPVTPDRIPLALRDIDVLVVPSIWYENSPVTIQEAFCARTPVVASRCGGMAEHVRDRVDGLLFTPGDVDDLRAKMRQLIDDDTLRLQLAAGVPAVKSIDAAAADLETLFGRLAAA